MTFNPSYQLSINVSRHNLWKFKFCPPFSITSAFDLFPCFSVSFACLGPLLLFSSSLSALEAAREHWRRDSNEIFEIQRRCHNRLRLDASAIVEQAFLLLLLFLLPRRGIEINFKIEIIRLAIINFSKRSIFDVCNSNLFDI